MAGTITHKWNGTILEITSDSGTSAADLKGVKGDTGARGARGLQGERGGGATIEDGIISTETTWSSAAIMDNFAESMSVSGNPVTCNPIPDYPLHIITDIEPKQDGSGEPYPTGAGKNLLPLQAGLTASSNGNTATVNEDGSITVTGTAGTSSTFITLCSFNLPAGTYTLSSETDTAFPSAGEAIRITTTSGVIAWTELNASRKNYVFQLAEASKVDFVIRVSAGTTVNHSFRAQLETGSAATQWVKASNIRPISGMDAVSVVRCGKNLLPKPTPKSGEDSGIKYTVSEDGTITANGTATANVVLPILGTYSPIKNVMPGITKGRYYARDAVVRITNAITNNSRYITYDFVLNENDYISFVYAQWTQSTTYTETKYYPMIVKYDSNTSLDYETYKGNTYSFAFGETVYSGSIDWNTGKLIINKKALILNGNENWQYLTDRNARRFALSINALNAYNDASKHICSHLTLSPYGGVLTAMPFGYFYMTSAWITIYDEYTAIPSLDEWKAYLAAQAAAGTPMTMLYELAEPYTIQLTPQEIKAISGTNTLYTDANDLRVIGRVDTMYQLSLLAERIAALEKKVN